MSGKQGHNKGSKGRPGFQPVVGKGKITPKTVHEMAIKANERTYNITDTNNEDTGEQPTISHYMCIDPNICGVKIHRAETVCKAQTLRQEVNQEEKENQENQIREESISQLLTLMADEDEEYEDEEYEDEGKNYSFQEGLNIWQDDEKQLLADNKGTNTSIKGTRLRKAMHAQLDVEMKNLVSLNIFSSEAYCSAVTSTYSAMGFSSERLFISQGNHLITSDTHKDSPERLVSIRSDKEFKKRIKELRTLNKKKLLTEDMLSDVAEYFFVTDNYVVSLVHDDPPVKIQYPDTVSIFERENGTRLIVAAEHKITGNLDSKSIKENLAALASMKTNIRYKNKDKTEIRTIIALPFTDIEGTAANRWKGDRIENPPDDVVINQDVWLAILGRECTDYEYDMTIIALATHGSRRVIQQTCEAKERNLINDRQERLF